MVKRFATITAVAAILTAASGASADQTFKARMSEEQEVPTPIGQGTSGKFEIQFNRDFTEGEYKLVINSGARILAGPPALRSGRRGRAGHHLPRGHRTGGRQPSPRRIRRRRPVDHQCHGDRRQHQRQHLVRQHARRGYRGERGAAARSTSTPTRWPSPAAWRADSSRATRDPIGVPGGGRRGPLRDFTTAALPGRLLR